MKFEDLPHRWKTKLKQYIHQHLDENRERPSAGDFKDNLRLDFPDGSHAYFRYAFYILDPDTNELAVFTEHCGYHLFPSYHTSLNLLNLDQT